MRIFLHECKKAFTSPILIALLMLFSAYNIFLIVNSSDHKEELKIVNELVEKYGREITEDSLHQFQKDIQVDLVELTKITGQEFNSVYDFLEGLRHEDQDLYGENDWHVINQLQLKEMYFGMATDIDENYAEIDLETMGAGEIKKYGLSGSAAVTLQREYKKFSKRFEEMRENREHNEWFFAGKAYYMHKLLFKTIFLHIIIESLLLIVLSTALITNYEFENRTHLVTYATPRGRKLMKDKLAASLATSAAITAILLAITLGTYFTIFDYSHVWGTSINSAFNWEYTFPHVAWWNVSVSAFLVGVIALVVIVMLLFSALTFALSVVVKNSYVTFFLMATFFVLAFLIPGFMPTSSNLLFITSYTLPTLVLNISASFMGSSGLILFKNFEWMTVGCWTMLTIVLCLISYKRFTKEDIQ